MPANGSETTDFPSSWTPRPVTEVIDGFDIPMTRWTEEDIAFWTGTSTYQPWKDVSAFFKGSVP